MASEILRPNSNANTLWGGYQYTSIDDVVTQPSTSVDANYAVTTKSDSSEEQSWGMENTTLSGDIDSIVLWFYARSANTNTFDMDIRLEVGSGNYTGYVTQNMNSSTWQWFSIEYTPSGSDWTTAQINDLRINFLSDSIMSSSVVFQLQAAYVEITEATGGGGDTYDETGSGGAESGGAGEDFLAYNITSDGGAEAGGSVLQAPNEVTGLTVTAYSDSQLSLSWTAPTDTNGLTISHYIIGRSIEGGAWAYDTTNDNSTTFVDGGQPPNRLHEYRVAAVTAAGQGLWSSTEGDTTFPYTEEGSGGAVAGGSAYVTSCGPLVIGCDHFTGAYVDFDNHYIDQLVGSNSEQWNVNTSTDDWLIENNQLKVDEVGITYLYADLQQADLYCVLTYTIASGSADNFQGIIFRWADADNYLRVGYNPYLQKLQFWKHINGSDELMASQTVVASGTVTLEVNASGVELTASINGGSPLFADTVFNQAETNIGVYNWKDNSGTLDPVYFDEVKFFDARMLEYGDGGSVGAGSASVTVNSSPTTAIAGSSLVAVEGTVTHIPVTYDETAAGGVSVGSTATYNALKQPTLAIAPASTVTAAPQVTPYTAGTIAGTSSISALPAVVSGVSTSISGESAVSAIPTVGSDLNIAVTATSSLSNVPTVTPDNSVVVSSTSSLTANPAVSGGVSATIAAVSSLSVTKTRVVSVESAISATSSLTITPTAVVGPSPAITGTSLLAASGAVVGNETTAITGTSSVLALPASIAGVSSTITGTSSLSSTATMVVLGSGSVAGTSSVAIVPAVTADMTGNITGTSSLTSLPAVAGGINSTITGTSAISALPRVKPVVVSAITSTSAVSSTAMLVLNPEGSLAGTSSLTVLPTVLPIVTASIDAISALTAVGGYRPKSIVQELGDYLQETSAITDIASNIYLGYLPETVTLPAVVYTRTRNIHINQLDGLAGVMEASITVELYSYSYLTNRNLMKAMRDSLSFYDGLMGSVNIDSIDFGEPVDSIEKMKEGSNQAIYKTTINLTVYHNENVAELV